tara:strand:+ start:29680 stop:30195 length:516 start_codon:yes stop_codon:yes gene_type:complete
MIPCIREKATNRIIYSKTRLVNGSAEGKREIFVNSADHDQVDVSSLPANYVDGGWTYIGTTWAELPEAESNRLEREIEQNNSTAKDTYIDEKIAARPVDYDELDTEVLKMLRTEVYHFDEGATTTPLCAIVATELSVTETTVRNSVRTKGNAYYAGLVTAWAKRRNVIGGA